MEQSGGDESRFTLYERNALGLITKITDPLGNSESFEYNEHAELISHHDKDGYDTLYTYDNSGELNEIKYADETSVRFSYDALHRLSEIKDQLGSISIVNDALGHTTRVTDHNGRVTGYEYGALGERKRIIYPTELDKDIRYLYDEKHRISGLDDGKRRVSFTYDEANRLQSKDYGNGVKTTYLYNAGGSLASMVHEDKDGIIDSFVYKYDNEGNKISVDKIHRGSEKQSGRFEHSYDVMNRLSLVKHNGELVRSYEYDTFGNRSKKNTYSNGKHISQNIYGYNAMNQLVDERIINPNEAVDSVSYQAGIFKSYTYDKRGNTTSVSSNEQLIRRYVFGTNGRLTSATNAAGRVARYDYDGLGNRRGRRDESTGRYTEYINDLTRPYHNVLGKLEEADSITYMWDEELIMTESYTNGMLDTAIKLHDEMGSDIRELSINGSLLSTVYDYDEFGARLNDTTSLSSWNKNTHIPGYMGYEWDDISGTYYANAREYDADTGRFISKDSDSYIHMFMPQSLNQYQFCLCNPLTYVDPSGNDSQCNIEDTKVWFNNIKIAGNNMLLKLRGNVNTAKNKAEEVCDRSLTKLFNKVESSGIINDKDNPAISYLYNNFKKIYTENVVDTQFFDDPLKNIKNIKVQGFTLAGNALNAGAMRVVDWGISIEKEHPKLVSYTVGTIYSSFEVGGAIQSLVQVGDLSKTDENVVENFTSFQRGIAKCYVEMFTGALGLPELAVKLEDGIVNTAASTIDYIGSHSYSEFEKDIKEWSEGVDDKAKIIVGGVKGAAVNKLNEMEVKDYYEVGGYVAALIPSIVSGATEIKAALDARKAAKAAKAMEVVANQADDIAKIGATLADDEARIAESVINASESVAVETTEVIGSTDEAANVAAKITQEAEALEATTAEVEGVTERAANLALENIDDVGKVSTTKPTAGASSTPVESGTKGGLNSTTVKDYSYKFDKELVNFNDGYEIRNAVDKELILVQYSSDAPDASLGYWTTIDEANGISTLEDYMNKLALSKDWGNRNVVKVARIPAGTNVKYAVGTAREQLLIADPRPGGGIQYFFNQFDTNWITEVRNFGN